MMATRLVTWCPYADGVTEADLVVELCDLPKSSIGTPLPVVVANEGALLVAYLVENTDEDWDGSSVRIADLHSDEPVALVEFISPYAHTLGPPNDEAFSAHPLAAKGLHPHGAFRVDRSSWIAEMERANSVHPHHRPESFKALSHFVLAFHDSTFECVASSYRGRVLSDPLRRVVAQMADRLAASDATTG